MVLLRTKLIIRLSRKHLPSLRVVSLNGNTMLTNIDVSAMRAVGDTDCCNASCLYLSDTGIKCTSNVVAVMLVQCCVLCCVVGTVPHYVTYASA